MSATLAANLARLRAEVWAAWPGTVVGWIGDAAHQAEQSDHNADACGVVHAVDVMVTGAKAKAVVTAAVGRDDVDYVIFNRVIWARSHGWTARAYTGSNPHTDHVHVSGRHGTQCYSTSCGTGYNKSAEADTSRWGVVPAMPPPPATTHKPGSRTLRLADPLMTGDDVAYVQKWIGPARAGAADGKFGSQTQAGVRWYQSMRGLTVDGVVGAQTWRSMGVSVA